MQLQGGVRRILVAALLLVLALSGLVAYRFIGSSSGEVVAIDYSIRADDFVQGNREAPTQLIEYSDLECRYCKQLHQSVLPRLLAEYPGELAVAYRHFPLHNRVPAVREARAAECAALQGGEKIFFAFIGRVFSVTASNYTLPESELSKIIIALGLNVDAFESCLANEETAEAVRKDMIEGTLLGIDRTPTVLVIHGGERRLVVGSGYAALKKAIDEMRAEGKSSQ
jgi:protein-disulfide isomerase